MPISTLSFASKQVPGLPFRAVRAEFTVAAACVYSATGYLPANAKTVALIVGICLARITIAGGSSAGNNRSVCTTFESGETPDDCRTDTARIITGTGKIGTLWSSTQAVLSHSHIVFTISIGAAKDVKIRCRFSLRLNLTSCLIFQKRSGDQAELISPRFA